MSHCYEVLCQMMLVTSWLYTMLDAVMLHVPAIICEPLSYYYLMMPMCNLINSLQVLSYTCTCTTDWPAIILIFISWFHHRFLIYLLQMSSFPWGLFAWLINHQGEVNYCMCKKATIHGATLLLATVVTRLWQPCSRVVTAWLLPGYNCCKQQSCPMYGGLKKWVLLNQLKSYNSGRVNNHTNTSLVSLLLYCHTLKPCKWQDGQILPLWKGQALRALPAQMARQLLWERMLYSIYSCGDLMSDVPVSCCKVKYVNRWLTTWLNWSWKTCL